MALDPKIIVAKVRAKLGADDPDKEYYSFENDTIKQTSGRDYTLKEWITLHLDDFTEDIIDIPLKDSEKENLFSEIKEEFTSLLSDHIKKFFQKNKKVDEDTWDDEVKDLKKQITKHYRRVPTYIEKISREYIRELNSTLKLV